MELSSTSKDIVPLIYALRGKLDANSRSGALEGQCELVQQYLLQLEKIYGDFDHLALVLEIKKSLANQFLTNEILKETSSEGVSVRNFVHSGGLEPLKRTTATSLSAENLSVQECLNDQFSQRSSYNKKHKSGGSSFSFNFDDLPEFESLDSIMAVLRENDMNDLTALDKVLKMEIADFIDHPLWDEFLILLYEALVVAAAADISPVHNVNRCGASTSTSAGTTSSSSSSSGGGAESTSHHTWLLVMTILQRLLVGLSGSLQGLDVMNCLLRYLVFEWVLKEEEGHCGGIHNGKQMLAAFIGVIETASSITAQHLASQKEFERMLMYIFLILTRGKIALLVKSSSEGHHRRHRADSDKNQQVILPAMVALSLGANTGMVQTLLSVCRAVHPLSLFSYAVQTGLLKYILQVDDWAPMPKSPPATAAVVESMTPAPTLHVSLLPVVVVQAQVQARVVSCTLLLFIMTRLGSHSMWLGTLLSHMNELSDMYQWRGDLTRLANPPPSGRAKADVIGPSNGSNRWFLHLLDGENEDNKGDTIWGCFLAITSDKKYSTNIDTSIDTKCGILPVPSSSASSIINWVLLLIQSITSIMQVPPVENQLIAKVDVRALLGLLQRFCSACINRSISSSSSNDVEEQLLLNLVQSCWHLLLFSFPALTVKEKGDADEEINEHQKNVTNKDIIHNDGSGNLCCMLAYLRASQELMDILGSRLMAMNQTTSFGQDTTATGCSSESMTFASSSTSSSSSSRQASSSIKFCDIVTHCRHTLRPILKLGILEPDLVNRTNVANKLLILETQLAFIKVVISETTTHYHIDNDDYSGSNTAVRDGDHINYIIIPSLNFAVHTLMSMMTSESLEIHMVYVNLRASCVDLLRTAVMNAKILRVIQCRSSSSGGLWQGDGCSLPVRIMSALLCTILNVGKMSVVMAASDGAKSDGCPTSPSQDQSIVQALLHLCSSSMDSQRLLRFCLGLRASHGSAAAFPPASSSGGHQLQQQLIRVLRCEAEDAFVYENAYAFSSEQRMTAMQLPLPPPTCSSYDLHEDHCCTGRKNSSSTGSSNNTSISSGDSVYFNRTGSSSSSSSNNPPEHDSSPNSHTAVMDMGSSSGHAKFLPIWHLLVGLVYLGGEFHDIVREILSLSWGYLSRNSSSPSSSSSSSFGNTDSDIFPSLSSICLAAFSQQERKCATPIGIMPNSPPQLSSSTAMLLPRHSFLSSSEGVYPYMLRILTIAALDVPCSMIIYQHHHRHTSAAAAAAAFTSVHVGTDTSSHILNAEMTPSPPAHLREGTSPSCPTTSTSVINSSAPAAAAAAAAAAVTSTASPMSAQQSAPEHGRYGPDEEEEQEEQDDSVDFHRQFVHILKSMLPSPLPAPPGAKRITDFEQFVEATKLCLAERSSSNSNRSHVASLIDLLPWMNSMVGSTSESISFPPLSKLTQLVYDALDLPASGCIGATASATPSPQPPAAAAAAMGEDPRLKVITKWVTLLQGTENSFVDDKERSLEIFAHAIRSPQFTSTILEASVVRILSLFRDGYVRNVLDSIGVSIGFLLQPILTYWFLSIMSVHDVLISTCCELLLLHSKDTGMRRSSSDSDSHTCAIQWIDLQLAAILWQYVEWWEEHLHASSIEMNPVMSLAPLNGTNVEVFLNVIYTRKLHGSPSATIQLHRLVSKMNAILLEVRSSIVLQK